jgi:hypothetical protein
MLSLFSNKISMQGKFTIAAILFISLLSSCSNSGSNNQKTFCDTICQKDSIKFRDEENTMRPYVYISAKDCRSDSLKWGYAGGTKTTIDFRKYKLNKDFTRCFINDTSYAWLMFNVCETGRGYLVRLPFHGNHQILNAAINNFDPKFSVANGLAAYTDKGNIFVEDMANGKKAMMTFGQGIEMDLNSIHDAIDSVNITQTRIWAKVKIDGNWKEIEKTIVLK